MYKKFLKVIIMFFIVSAFIIDPCYAESNSNKIIYVDGINGNDETGTGLTPSSSVKSLKKAYELLVNGGSIYIVDTISITDEITLTDKQYKDKDSNISLIGDAKIAEIKRYSKPIAYESLIGFNVESNQNLMFHVRDTGILTIENLLFDGHSEVVNNSTNELNAKGINDTQTIFKNNGNLFLTNTILQNNHTKVNGGAIDNTGKIQIAGSKIKGMTANFGAAIYNFGTLEINDVKFHDNTTTKSGGAILAAGQTNIKSSEFYNNKASAGGAVYGQGVTKLYNCKVYNNESTGSGGALFISTDYEMEIKNCDIHDNKAIKYGAGIFANGTFTIENSKLYNNNAVDGAAISAGGYGKLFQVKNCEIYNNSATGIGGAIEGYGNYEIIDTNIHNNTAADGGGLWNNGTVTLTNVNIHDNKATKNGNSIYQNGTIQIKNDVLIENDIYLCANKKIDILSKISANANYIMTPKEYNLGQTIVSISDELNELASDMLKNFKLTPNEKYIARPGDLNTTETISDKDIIISKINVTITYDKNTSSNVKNVPEPTHIYWAEKVVISDIIPNREGYEFIGWDINPNGNMTDEELEDFLNNLTEDTILYANYDKKPVNPSTSDNIMNYIISLILSFTVLIGLLFLSNKKTKEQ